MGIGELSIDLEIKILDLDCFLEKLKLVSTRSKLSVLDLRC